MAHCLSKRFPQTVYNRPDLIQSTFLDTFIVLWSLKPLEYWTKPTDDTDNTDDEYPDGPDSVPLICPVKSRHVFSNLINACLMHKLMHCTLTSFQALERLLMVLLEKQFLTISSLNEQFVSLLREEWPEVS